MPDPNIAIINILRNNIKIWCYYHNGSYYELMAFRSYIKLNSFFYSNHLTN